MSHFQVVTSRFLGRNVDIKISAHDAFLKQPVLCLEWRKIIVLSNELWFTLNTLKSNCSMAFFRWSWINYKHQKKRKIKIVHIRTYFLWRRFQKRSERTKLDINGLFPMTINNNCLHSGSYGQTIFSLNSMEVRDVWICKLVILIEDTDSTHMKVNN
jgi:hypothetical protein